MDDQQKGGGTSEDAPTRATDRTQPRPKGSGGTTRVDRSPPDPRTPAVRPLPASEVQRVPVSGMRAAIARRMHQSQREVPLFHAEREIRMDASLELCERLRRDGHPIALTHILLKATAESLLAAPEVNARFVGDAIEVLRRVHIAIATAVPEGLVFPVLHDTPGLNLLQISERVSALRKKADAKTLASEELNDASFTLANLGSRGVDRFTTVVHPPQAASLALGAVRRRPVARNDQLEIAATMYATLSCDHRAVDGQQAATYLDEFGRCLENPEQLISGIRLANS